MMDFKVEWVGVGAITKNAIDVAAYGEEPVPVVRLADVEKLIQEAVWAMAHIKELVQFKLDRHDQTWGELEKECAEHPSYQRAQAFLASVAAWRERKEKEKV